MSFKRHILFSFLLATLGTGVLQNALAADSDMDNFRWAGTSRTGAFADFTPAFRTEQRLQSYLEYYLDQSQYAIVVNPKPTSRPSRQAKPVPEMQSLPGLPGWSDSADGQKQSYFDLDGRFHLYPEDRPALSVEVVVDQGVDKNKLALFKRILPKVAGMDPARGDELRVSSGSLLRVPIASTVQAPPAPNWLETLANNRAAFLFLTVLFLAGTATVISVFYFLYRALSPVTYPNADKKEKQNTAAQPFQSLQKKSRYELGASDSNRKEISAPIRKAEILREITQETKKHPDRTARLICAWVSGGMVREAAWLTQNFDMLLAEQILRHVPAAESEKLRLQSFISLDAAGLDDQKLLNQARQELIFLGAKANRESSKQALSFLTELEPDVLMEVIDAEPIQNVAMVASHVPAPMMREYLAKRSHGELVGLFDALHKLGTITPESTKDIQELLKKKTERVRSLPLTENGKTNLMTDLLSGIDSSSAKKHIITHLEKVSPRLAARVRESVYFFEDIFNFGDDSLRVLFTEVDPIVISRALASSPVEWRERLVRALPRTSGEILQFEANLERTVTADETASAQSTVLEVLAGLVKQNILSAKGLEATESAAEVPIIVKEAA